MMSEHFIRLGLGCKSSFLAGPWGDFREEFVSSCESINPT